MVNKKEVLINATLTEIAKGVGLSITLVKKRSDKLLVKEIFYPKSLIRPKKFGYSTIVDVRIKLHHYTKKKIDASILFLREYPYVTEIFSISGIWDLSIVLFTKDLICF